MWPVPRLSHAGQYTHVRGPGELTLLHATAKWLWRPSRERKIRVRLPLAPLGIFSGSSHTSDLKTATPVGTRLGAWRYRVGAETGWPGVSMLRQGEVGSLIGNLCLGVAARAIV